MELEKRAGLSVLDLKEVNRRIVLRALKAQGESSVKALAVLTGLSTVTIGTIIQSLIAEGSASEGSLVPSNGGRPSRSYQFNEGKSLGLIAFTREVNGQDTLCLRVCNLYGAVIASREARINAASLSDFEPFFDAIFEEYPGIRAIGFGLPGIELGGKIVALDYQRLVGSPIIEHFENRYKVPVLFENDVNAAVLGRGTDPNPAPVEVYLYFPSKYPPGAGIRIGGEVLRGNRHFAGEISWLPLGIAWGTAEIINDRDACCEAIARVICSMTAVLDPDSFILFGEFLSNDYIESIKRCCVALLPERMAPAISLSESFTEDFQSGLIAMVLELIEQTQGVARA